MARKHKDSDKQEEQLSMLEVAADLKSEEFDDSEGIE